MKHSTASHFDVDSVAPVVLYTSTKKTGVSLKSLIYCYTTLRMNISYVKHC